MESEQIRMERVLDNTFRGLHNCPKIHKHNEGSIWEVWEVNTVGDLATFDFDVLTRLVIAAHEHCVRVSVNPSGPKMIKIRLWARKREGKNFERHPTIEEAIYRFRNDRR